MRSVLCKTQFSFFVFGQAPVPAELQRRDSNSLHKCFRYLPSVVHIYLIYLSCLEFFVNHDSNGLIKSWITIVVGNLYNICAILLISLSIFAPYTNSTKFMRVQKLFEEIDHDLKRRLNMTFNTKLFIRKYFIKIICIIVVGSLCSLPKIVFIFDSNSYSSRVELEIAFFYFRFAKYIIMIHALFYVELLKTFVNYLREFSFMCNDNHLNFTYVQHRCLFNSFLQYKTVHYKLFMMTRHLNDIFGWIFVALILLTIVDFNYIGFYIFYYLRKDQYIYVLSMYIFL